MTALFRFIFDGISLPTSSCCQTKTNRRTHSNPVKVAIVVRLIAFHSAVCSAKWPLPVSCPNLVEQIGSSLLMMSLVPNENNYAFAGPTIHDGKIFRFIFDGLVTKTRAAPTAPLCASLRLRNRISSAALCWLLPDRSTQV